MALLPKEITSKVFAPFGGLLLTAVVHTICVDVAVPITHAIPSMTTEAEAVFGSKLVPVIVITVPPTLGPKEGLIFVTVDVFAS